MSFVNNLRVILVCFFHSIVLFVSKRRDWEGKEEEKEDEDSRQERERDNVSN